MRSDGQGRATLFPPRIGRVADRELAANGFTQYADLQRTRPRELLAIHGIGPKAVRILGEELAARGLAWADESAPPPSDSRQP